jgi:hypothetical protein
MSIHPARSRHRRLLAATGLALAIAAPAVAHADGGRGHDAGPRLEGRAVLPVETYAPGPPAGRGLVPVGQQTIVIRGITFPTPSQPVAGFSGIVEGQRPGEWLAMTDNGFGAKENSFDFRIRAYTVRPDFKTARGGHGGVEVVDFIEFSDPDGLIGFPIVNESTDRVLTGADIDPESLQRGRDGTLWVGDEFGPWILHFDAEGRLLEAPYVLPDGLAAATNPLHTGPATLGNSRGIEAMAITPNGRLLYVVLEGAVVGDDPQSRRIYEFDTRRREFTVRLADYRTESAGNLMADAQALGRHRLLVIERDNNIGADATFRGIYEVDLRKTGADGAVVKERVVDLAALADPKLVSLPEIHPGDIGIGDPFRVTCQSVEALRIVSATRLLVGCDNNLPNAGRNPNLADDNELITVEVPRL